MRWLRARLWWLEILRPIVEAELKQNALSKAPRLRPAFEGNTARLRSAVALVMNGSLV